MNIQDYKEQLVLVQNTLEHYKHNSATNCAAIRVHLTKINEECSENISVLKELQAASTLLRRIEHICYFDHMLLGVQINSLEQKNK
jgi:hypothetical protein